MNTYTLSTKYNAPRCVWYSMTRNRFGPDSNIVPPFWLILNWLFHWPWIVRAWSHIYFLDWNKLCYTWILCYTWNMYTGLLRQFSLSDQIMSRPFLHVMLFVEVVDTSRRPKWRQGGHCEFISCYSLCHSLLKYCMYALVLMHTKTWLERPSILSQLIVLGVIGQSGPFLSKWLHISCILLLLDTRLKTIFSVLQSDTNLD